MRRWSFLILALIYLICCVSADVPGGDTLVENEAADTDDYATSEADVVDPGEVPAFDNFPAGRYIYLALLNPAQLDNSLEKRKKPKKLTPLEKARKARDDFYTLKFHANDDYAKWAEDRNLKRSLHESRATREVIWSQPDKHFVDIGAGTGKVWRADTEGFIHDDSHLIANITAAEMEQIGIAARHDITLPPRLYHDEDPPGTTATAASQSTSLMVNATATATNVVASETISQTKVLAGSHLPSSREIGEATTTAQDANPPRAHARSLSQGRDKKALARIPQSAEESALMVRQTGVEEVAALAMLMMPIFEVALALSVLLILAGVIALIVQLTLMLMRHHPKNPEGKVHFAFDWDNIPYQYDNKYPPMGDTPPSPTANAPPGGCDTWNIPDLQRRGWTTTQYAMHPCPTAIPAECSREWYETRSQEKHITAHNHRRNPVYCFEYAYFNTKNGKDVYKEAIKQERLGVGQYSQYSGHTLAALDGCFKDEKEMLRSKKCRGKYMDVMKHHNIEWKDCQKEKPGELCDEMETRYLRVTTGWPKSCKKAEPMCWE